MIEIDDNDRRLLLNALSKGEVVLVLGAGASATSLNAAGEPVLQARALAGLLAAEAGFKYNNEELPDVIGATVGPRLSAVQFQRILAKEYTRVRPSEELTSLVEYTWRRLYTWNIDDALWNINGGVQRRRFFNGLSDKVIAHEGLEYLSVIYLHGDALKPAHGFIFGPAEYNARLNKDTHDWYREAVADYVAFTPLFIGSRLNEPILSAELDRARPSPDAGLGRAFLVTPDDFSPVMQANLAARNIVALRATLKEFVDWLKPQVAKQVTPIDVARRINAVARELNTRLELNAADVDAVRHVRLRMWADTKREADALTPTEKQRLGRMFLEGNPPTWVLAATDIPVRLSVSEGLHQELEKSVGNRDRVFVAYGQSGSGKTTALMQVLLQHLNGWPDTALYEIGSNTPSLRAALSLIARLHRDEHVLIYIPDAFAFADTMYEELTTFNEGQFTVITSCRSGEWRDHIHRRIGEIATAVQFQRFEEADYEPLIQRLLTYVPAPRFRRLDSGHRVAKLRSSRSQLLIALKETTESARFTAVISREFDRLPDDDSRYMVLLAGIATIARTGISEAMAREAYSLLRLTRSYDDAKLSAAGIVSVDADGRLTARHELYVRHIFDNVASVEAIVNTIVSILSTYTKYEPPVVRHVNRLDSLLFKFLLNHNFNAELGRRRSDMDAFKSVYDTFEVAFQLDGHFWLQYGEYLVEKNDLELALDALNKSIQAYPDNLYAVHAYADVQLRVAAIRTTYDSVTIEMIGEAVRALELQQAARISENTDQYPLVTLANHHVNALIAHRQDASAQQAAKRYFRQLEELSKRNSAQQVQWARERLAQYLTLGRWVPTGRPGNGKAAGGRSHRHRLNRLRG